MELSSILTYFIREHALENSSILVALSGGFDSTALFHSLLECRQEFPNLRIGTAHINHNWRPESVQEAQQLEQLMHNLQISWHLHTLDPNMIKGNLEDGCRMERLKFFKETCQLHQYDGVMVAHHADDQAETVLKRLFEGAKLLSCKGMNDTYQIEGLKIWRPFVNIKKREITSWLNNKGFQAFDDPTNRDNRYTRARMRSQLIPHLSELFGKEIAIPLCRVGEELQEWDDFLQKTIIEKFPPIERGWAGWKGNILTYPNAHPLLVKYYLQNLLLISGLTLSYTQTTQAVRNLLSGAANKVYPSANGQVYIDRFHLFALPSDLVRTNSKDKLPLKIGQNSWNGWHINVNEAEKEPISIKGWEAAWNGKIESAIPPGEYFLGEGFPQAVYRPAAKLLGRWWTEKKVPSFLRTQLPVLWKEGDVVAEFLSPIPHIKGRADSFWKVAFSRE